MILAIRRSVALRFLSVCSSALWIGACSGEAIVGEETEAGDGDGDAAGDGDGDGDSSTPCENLGPPTPVPAANAFGSLAGTTWEGYFEGGEDVTLLLGTDGTGTFLVGEERAFDPPVDPDTGYLCDPLASTSNNCYLMDSFEGWPFSIEGAELSTRRFQFSIVLSEPWDAWCGLQTPARLIPHESCSYGIHELQNAEAEFAYSEGACFFGDHDNPSRDQVDCSWGQLALQRTCTCNAEECFGTRDTSPMDLTANEDLTELTNSEGLRLFLVE